MLQVGWINEGHLYLCGYAKGNGSFTFGGTEMTASETLSPIIGRLDNSLCSDWLTLCPSSPINGKSALQNAAITVCSDNLWLCGMFNQKICDPTDGTACITGRGNKAFDLMTDRTTEAPKNWDVLMACFSLPDNLIGGINAPEIQPSDCNNHHITANTIYDLTGRPVATTDNIGNLTPGIYISNRRKFIVR